MTERRATEAPSIRPADLAIEAHNRIANHLAALVSITTQQLPAIQAGPASVPREAVVERLTEVAGKILAVSRLHHMLAAKPEQGEVALEDVVMAILKELHTSGIFGDRLRATSTLDGFRVAASQALTLTLAFSEIVTNAMKHAHPTGLPVELSVGGGRTADGGVALHVSDDGVGFPEGFVEARDAGIGLKLVRSLVENAGGRLDTKSDELGLTVSIELPPG